MQDLFHPEIILRGGVTPPLSNLTVDTNGKVYVKSLPECSFTNDYKIWASWPCVNLNKKYRIIVKGNLMYVLEK